MLCLAVCMVFKIGLDHYNTLLYAGPDKRSIVLAAIPGGLRRTAGAAEPLVLYKSRMSGFFNAKGELMLDLRFIRENAEKIRWAVQVKHIDLDLDQLLAVDQNVLKLKREIQLRNE